jgi:hypothetical protein
LPCDGAVCEFGSAVDAVECAARLQQGMAEREAGVPEEERIRFRIGVNLGDVIHDEGDLYGDGVNIAARLEGIADPGGICVSHTVHEYVRGKVAHGFRPLGPRRVKNISEPVEAYSVDFAGVSARRHDGRPRRRLLLAAVAAGLLVLLTTGGWWLRGWWTDSGAAPRAAGRPSIAVLAFDNLSGDPAQEYFSDRIAEDIFTALARSPQLTVIARNSSFAYKGRAVDATEIGRALVHPHRTPCASWFPVRSGRDASAHLRPQAER